MSIKGEKDKLIKKLLEQDKTYREIMELAHVSPKTIKRVDDQRKVESEPAPKSNRLKAFELFEIQYPQGSNLYQVVTELDISVKDAEDYQIEYFRLKSRDELTILLQDKKLSGLVNVYRQMLSQGLTVDRLAQALTLSASLANMEYNRRKLDTYIRSNRNQIIRLDNVQAELLEKVSNLNKEIRSLSESKEIEEQELSYYRVALKIIKNTKEIESIEQIATKVGQELFDDNKPLIAAAGASVLKTFASDSAFLSYFNSPAYMEMFISFVLNPGPLGNESPLYRNTSTLLHVYCDYLIKAISEGTINVLGSKKFESGSDLEEARINKMISLYKHSPHFAKLLQK
jgi:hypothetical protein